MVLGISGIALANNGKGKGLETAPGQSENFSKGITTVVAVEEVTVESEDIDVQVSEDSTTETKSETTVTTNTTEEQVKVFHPNAHKQDSNQPGWYRYDTIVTTVTTTIISTWDETTTVTTTTTTVTPITTVEIIETTIQHRGAPGSNGEVISETSQTISSVTTEGEQVITTETSTVVTLGEVTTTSSSVTSSETIEGEGWIKP